MPRIHPKSNGDGEIEGVGATSTPNQGQSTRKRHVCPTCERCFTTSGHLARHSRVHTGEKNHKCPFPGCDTRCSRQDNLQQHYRIHLSPGSRRTSSRTSASRRGRRGTTNNHNTSAPSEQQDYLSASEQPPLSPPPLVPATIPTPSLSPPPLEPGRDAKYSSSPDSPPPLAHATIAPYQHAHHHRASPASSATSSPDASFPPSGSMLPISTPPPASVHSSILAPPTGYGFRTSATYQEQSGNNAGYPYAQNTSSASENYTQPSSESYSNNHYSLPRIDTLTSVKDDLSASPSISVSSTSLNNVNSRHSISHISHSHSQSTYPRMLSSSLNSRPSTGPPSPASSNSTSHSVISHSGPPTPSGYTTYDTEGGGQSSPYDQTSPPLSGHSGGSIIEPSLSRYSPPPVLAPIHSFTSHNEQYDRRTSDRGDYSDRYAHYETRYVQSDEPRYVRSAYGVANERQELSPVQAYMPHPSSAMANFHDMYSPVDSVSLHHGAWKSEHLTNRGMKSINALVQ